MEKIIGDAGAPHNANSKHLGEYIAASAILHTADGWGYLGRAIGAQCRGDVSVARHLAYYAELRAALGLLSTQGIAIVSTRNAVLNTAGGIEFFPGGTHRMAWQALEHWSDQPSAAALLSTIAQPGGVALADWVSGLGIGTTGWNPLGREWLRAWGLDLRMFNRDRDARNDASYRPTALRQAPSTPNADATFVQRFWPLFEPTAGEPFRHIDRHLLRLSLERAFETVTGRQSVGDPDFSKALGRTLAANAGVDLGTTLGQFLGRALDPSTPALFVAAGTRASHLDSNFHAHVIARAALLLRVATGASNLLLSNAGIEPVQYRFWSEALAETHGVCDTGALPIDPADLWADVDDALQGLTASVVAGWDRSFFTLLDTAASAIEVLSGCERVAIWGLAA